jgi:quinol monooxygenase YgiN
MAIRHVVTIQVAPGKSASFASAFQPLQAVAQEEEGCQQYELFQSLDDPDKMVMLERWSSQKLLDKHMAEERTRNAALLTPWWPCGRPAYSDSRALRGLKRGPGTQ